jgi:hypothetical protein
MPDGSSLLPVVLERPGCVVVEAALVAEVVVVSEAGDEANEVAEVDADGVSTVAGVCGPAQALANIAPIKRPMAVRSSAVRDLGPTISTIVHAGHDVDTAGSLPIPWQSCTRYC